VEVEALRHIFLTSVLNGGAWLASRPVHFTAEKTAKVPTGYEAGQLLHVVIKFFIPLISHIHFNRVVNTLIICWLLYQNFNNTQSQSGECTHLNTKIIYDDTFSCVMKVKTEDLR
jgi:hypothetical protein